MSTEDTGVNMMQTTRSTADLKASIARLERKRVVMEDNLQEKFHEILESLKPANLLRATLHEVRESVPLRNNLLKVVLGLGAGYFSRKLIVGKSAGVFKKALGTALQFGITHFIAKKDDEDGGGLKDKLKNILQKIFSGNPK